jgi:hypothetical protein
MIGSAPTPRALDWRDAESQHAFLRSQRARSACAREVTRVGELVLEGATRLAREYGLPLPDARPSADRSIVQLGPVALSLAWLKVGKADTPDCGQLLAIAWRGVLASRGGSTYAPERTVAASRAVAPVALWEQALTPSATTADDWHWHAQGLDESGHTSDEVAARCVAELRTALEALLPAPVVAQG